MEIVQAVLIEEILDYLTVPDLLCVRAVCKAWQHKVDNVLSRKEKRFCADALSISHCWEDEDPIMREDGMIKFDKDSEVYDSLAEWRNRWQCVPKFAICTCMCCDGLEKKVKKSFTSETAALLQEWMPPNCQVLTVPSIESIVCSETLKTPMENCVEEIMKFYNILTLSDCPGRIAISMLNIESKSRKEVKNAFHESLQKEIEDPNLKMLLVFQNVKRHLGAESQRSKFYKQLTSALDKNVVVVGSLYADPMILHHQIPSTNQNPTSNVTTSSVQDCVVVSFKGANAKSASVLLSYEIDTTAKLHRELERLKITVENLTEGCPMRCKNRIATGYCYACNTQIIGFMIACCARADSMLWYENENVDVRNVEQKAFRTHIPNVPLLGTFGMGEIGESVNLFDGQSQSFSKDLLKGECTVFSVLVF